jgi:hypothetical protein
MGGINTLTMEIIAGLVARGVMDTTDGCRRNRQDFVGQRTDGIAYLSSSKERGNPLPFHQ